MSWKLDDRLRPLSEHGRRQALDLADLIADSPLTRVLSSPYVRCTETVAPLAERLGLGVEQHDSLAEGTLPSGVLLLVDSVGESGAILCSHGDVIPRVLEHFTALGADLGPEPTCAKGSIWVIETEGSGAVSARYLPPPTR